MKATDYRFGLAVGTLVVTPSAPRVTVCVRAGFTGGIVGAEGVDGAPPPFPPVPALFGIESSVGRGSGTKEQNYRMSDPKDPPAPAPPAAPQVPPIPPANPSIIQTLTESDPRRPPNHGGSGR